MTFKGLSLKQIKTVSWKVTGKTLNIVKNAFYFLVLVAGFRVGLAGLNLGYPEKPALIQWVFKFKIISWV